MKKIILVTALSLALCGGTAMAMEPYVSVGGGVAFLADSDVDGSSVVFNDTNVAYDSGYIFRGAVGAKFDTFRLELEGFYGENDTDDVNIMNVVEVDARGTLSVTGALINGYYDLQLGYPVVPYVSAGLGYANVELDSTDDDVFAYTFGFGVAYEVNKTLALDLGYRYLATEDANVGFISDFSYESNQLLAGVRFSF